ncbi:lysine-sensitive aspartokinase 3 [Algicola sagamiensis]|uniref:lysine-sensitive aspartokinase 3 n=1 Tax=Algicola sagamiensis TaxID=163869 RepID=UPI0003652C5E|nr:lysine-sensitive aspartokinase 3 [Algicola sagamiensis]
MLNHIVAKFGGTSVADREAMQRCADIVTADPNRRIVVLSASAGVTNALVAIGQSNEQAARQEHVTTILNIQSGIWQALGQPEVISSNYQNLIEEFEGFVGDLSESVSQEQKDYLLSFGERFSTMFFTQLLQQQGTRAVLFDARDILKTDARFGEALPDAQQTRENVEQHVLPLLKDNVVVTQGFIGSTGEKRTTTLGRGGSDYSAAIFAEASQAASLEIWTDVIGIYTTDPRLTSSAYPLPELSFDEAAEMATFGAKVLHPATLIPAIRQNINVFVGSSRAPEQGGSWIRLSTDDKPAYRAIALRANQTLVTLKSPEMLHATGFLAQVFGILSKYQISVDLITTSEISVALTLDHTAGPEETRLPEQCLKELRECCEVTIERDLALVAIIGNQLHSTQGVSSKVFHSLDQYNIRMICHGASQHNLCFLVENKVASKIVSDLHAQLF